MLIRLAVVAIIIPKLCAEQQIRKSEICVRIVLSIILTCACMYSDIVSCAGPFQGLFQDFTREGANALWQISRGGGGNNILLNIGKPIARRGTSISRGAKTPPAPLK